MLINIILEEDQWSVRPLALKIQMFHSQTPRIHLARKLHQLYNVEILSNFGKDSALILIETAFL